MPIRPTSHARSRSLRRLRHILLRGAALAFVVATPAIAATFSVNSTGDANDANPGDGFCFTGVFIPIGAGFLPECTLRAAISETNALPGSDVVQFAATLPKVASVVEISPQSQLPVIRGRLTIDGASADGYAIADPFATPIIQLGGAQAGGGARGLVLGGGSNGSIVRALAIHGFEGHGITARPETNFEWVENIAIEGCQIGISRGVFYLGNGGSGIYLYRVRESRVGGLCNAASCAAKGNVLASNAASGLTISTGVFVTALGNRIGTDRFGNSTFVPFGGATPNAGWGIWLIQGGRNTIGSLEAGGGNLVSGNEAGGIRVDSIQNLLVGNRIGTNRDGTAALPNEGDGIDVTLGGNFVGIAERGNLVSGNAGYGIHVSAPTTIESNTVGLSLDEQSEIGNPLGGIFVEGDASLVQDNIVGGNGSDIADAGISITGNDHRVYANLVGTNSLGSDLGNAGGGIAVRGAGTRVGGPGQGNIVGFQTVGISIAVDASDAIVQGNWVGTDAAGASLPNTYGIAASGEDVLIGSLDGLTNGSGNTVANAFYGVTASYQSIGTQILGNWIGTNANGDPMGNQQGIRLRGSDNAVGGLPDWNAVQVAAGANVIANNVQGGVVTDATSITGNSIRGNRIEGHVGVLGIDLEFDGVTANDFGDVDLGANQRQNTPEFDLAQTSINASTGELEVRYRVHSNEADAAYPLAVDFHLRAGYDEEAGLYLGSDSYPAASATLYRAVAITPLVDLEGLGGVLVATATDANGNTSELSRQWVPLPEPGGSAGLLVGGLGAFALRRRRIARA
ncbi:MAG: right-handed parallel beta-helix repeat-containing protein [Myxococcota bacterium]